MKVKVKMIKTAAGPKGSFTAPGEYQLDAKTAQEWAKAGICKILELEIEKVEPEPEAPKVEPEPEAPKIETPKPEAPANKAPAKHRPSRKPKGYK